MIDIAFCEILAQRISSQLANGENKHLKSLWCDGVLLPTFDNEYSPKYVNDNRQITMIAFIGIDGQDRYELTLLFGRKALSSYARGLDISNCISYIEEDNWLEIDLPSKRIQIQLL